MSDEILPALDIKEELVGDITVLYVCGRLTIGAPSEHFNDYCMRVIKKQRNKFIVELSNVAQLDSSGISAIVKCGISLARSNGWLRLVASPGRVREAIMTTQLVEHIPTFASVSHALKLIAASPFYCFCPLCDSLSDPALSNEAVRTSQLQTCTHCHSELCVDVEPEQVVTLRSLKIAPYGKGLEDNLIEIRSGWMLSVRVVGRLDLFTWHSLKIALRSIPPLKKVLIDVGKVTEVSTGARDELLAFVANSEGINRFSICLEGLPFSRSALFDVDSRFIYSSEKAVSAAYVRDPGDQGPWLLRIERLT
jgi:anti-anti-sigma factor